MKIGFGDEHLKPFLRGNPSRRPFLYRTVITIRIETGLELNGEKEQFD